MSFDANYGLPLHPDDQALVDYVAQALQAQEEATFAEALRQREFENNQAAAAALEQQAAIDVTGQQAAIERQLGRPLTTEEIRGIGTEVGRYVEAGREPDIYEAIGQLTEEGRPLLDIDKRSDRIAFMTSRVHEAEQMAAGVDVFAAPEPSREAYDLNDRDDRVALMVDRVAGANTEGRAYESSGGASA